MYSESLSSPLCHGQSVLVKESPTVVMQIILQQKGVCYENTNNRMGCQFELTMLLYRVFLCLSATFLKFHTKLSDNKKDNRDDCLRL